MELREILISNQSRVVVVETQVGALANLRGKIWIQKGEGEISVAEVEPNLFETRSQNFLFKKYFLQSVWRMIA